jgi:hypothetical protein
MSTKSRKKRPPVPVTHDAKLFMRVPRPLLDTLERAAAAERRPPSVLARIILAHWAAQWLVSEGRQHEVMR